MKKKQPGQGVRQTVKKTVYIGVSLDNKQLRLIIDNLTSRSKFNTRIVWGSCSIMMSQVI